MQKYLSECHTGGIFIIFAKQSEIIQPKALFYTMYEYLQNIKQRYGIIGNHPKLLHALDRAVRVSPTDISVLVTGESGTGKEVIPQIIHQNSHRKHGPYFAVNCGAIPEGTIDSELFGHEKGAFTGAITTRKGYFEMADKGTLFLDEVGELPLTTQVRLLRVLENGEFIKVGSSKVQKTDVRIVAATNKDLLKLVDEGKFREDLYYRLNTVQIDLPPLRERKDDIYLLFRKFVSDFSHKYGRPPVRLTPDAINLLKSYHWPGNIRQLKNIAEQICILEEDRLIDAERLKKYLPDYNPHFPSLVISKQTGPDFTKEKEIIFKMIFELKNELDHLKDEVKALKTPLMLQHPENHGETLEIIYDVHNNNHNHQHENGHHEIMADNEEESLSLQDREKDLIIKALKKHNGRRKKAAEELGISERTLYRKIKQYDIES